MQYPALLLQSCHSSVIKGFYSGIIKMFVHVEYKTTFAVYDIPWSTLLRLFKMAQKWPPSENIIIGIRKKINHQCFLNIIKDY